MVSSKFIFVSVSVFVLALLEVTPIQSAYAAVSSLCPGESGYYYVNHKRRNPTQGGFVSDQAFVDDTDYNFIAPTAAVCGSSKIEGNARIYGTARIIKARVSGSAEVFDNAIVADGAEITESAKVSGDAKVYGSVRVQGKGHVGGRAQVWNSSIDNLVVISGDAIVSGDARITQDAQVTERARVMGNAKLDGDVLVRGSAVIRGYTKLSKGEVNAGIKDDPDYEGIEKARVAAEQEKNRIEAEATSQRNLAAQKQLNREKIDNLWLELNQVNTFRSARSVNISNRCQLTMVWDVKKSATVVSGGNADGGRIYREDETYTAVIDLKEPIKLTANSNKNCITLDLSKWNGNMRTSWQYKDNMTGYETNFTSRASNTCLPLYEVYKRIKTGEIIEKINSIAKLCKEL
jgi:carbonic anhydrase/acetyltransferase-like protein (isoleucine patch superfamily)